MNAGIWLAETVGRLSNSNVPSARLDALVLLEDFTGKDRSWLLAHPELEIADTSALNKQIERRAKHEPLAYIRGKSEFYGRDFMVSADTLEPRPETETIIEMLKDMKNEVVADIGTGSGCLAITADLELVGVTVHATEISEAALEIARQNNKELKGSVQFYRGSLLKPLIEQKIAPDVIITNLPYVPDSHTINQAATFEPRLAIFGGEDGLDLYRELFVQVKQLPGFPAHIMTESLPFQHTELAQIAMAAGYKLKTSQDFIQIFERN